VPLPQALAAVLAARGEALPEEALAVRLPDHTLLPPPAAAAATPEGGPRPAAATPFGPVVCIEIKPKCGFLPASPCMHPPHAELKRRLTRYALHLALKRAEGTGGAGAAAVSGAPPLAPPPAPLEEGEAAAYCPLDFFSGEPARLARALRALARSPVNNLRAFVDGAPAWPPASPPPATAAAGLASLGAALRGFGAPPGAPPAAAAAAALDAAAAALAAEAPLLARLLALQRLDAADVEGIAPVYDSLMADLRRGSGGGGGGGELEEAERGGEGDGEEGGAQPLGTDGRPPAAARAAASAGAPSTPPLLAAAAAAAAAAAGGGPAAAVAALVDAPRAARLALLRDFLVAATAKDCALMVTLQAVEAAPACGGSTGGAGAGPWPRLLRLPGGAAVRYAVAVVDLDLKPASKLPSYRALDARILSHALAARLGGGDSSTDGGGRGEAAPLTPDGRWGGRGGEGPAGAAGGEP